MVRLNWTLCLVYQNSDCIHPGVDIKVENGRIMYDLEASAVLMEQPCAYTCALFGLPYV